LPRDCLIQLSHRDIKALLQLVFERADDLTAILERLCVLNAYFEGEMGDGHGARCQGQCMPGLMRRVDFSADFNENPVARALRAFPNLDSQRKICTLPNCSIEESF
jgi:hypothetical protein